MIQAPQVGLGRSACQIWIDLKLIPKKLVRFGVGHGQPEDKMYFFGGVKLI